VSDCLPFEDPSTAEGNFIRCLQVDRDGDQDHAHDHMIQTLIPM